MARHARLSPKAWAALATVYVVWGSTYLGIRITVRTLPPLLSMSARFALAGAILILVARPWRGPGWTARHWRNAALIGLALVGATSLVALGERTVDSGTAALIVCSSPLWFALFDWALFRRRRPARLVIAGIALGFAGVAVLVGPSGHVSPVGGACVLVGAALWPLGSLYARGAEMPPSPLLGAGMQMLAGAVPVAILAVARGEAGSFHPEAVSGASLAAWLYLLLAGSVVAFTAYSWLLRNVPTSIVSTYAFVNPVVAVLLGAAILGERVTWWTVGAGGLVVAAVALIVLAPRADPAPASDPATVQA